MKRKFIKNILGISILEALVSTAIIGIGFVAILQMTNYSVQSIYTSGERTKANYLTSMIAEDVIGNKKMTDDAGNNFSNILNFNSGGWNSDFCDQSSDAVANVGQIYAGAESNDGLSIKTNKWSAILNNKSYLGCRGNKEQRNFVIFPIGAEWTSQPITNSETISDTDDNHIVKDQVMYIGRIQMNLNEGKKRKYLYFQTDYVLRGTE